MDLLVNIGLYLAVSLFGYLFGSINNAVIISNVFFNKDVRHYGSKNAGGTNTGRVFGKKAGFAVMVLDVLKTLLVYWIITLVFTFTKLGNRIDFSASIHLAMLLTAVGHCYPIYYKFKGGKAVSTVAGFMLATNWLLFILAIILFLTLLKLHKIVSFSSIFSAVGVVFLSLLLLIPTVKDFSFYPLVSNNLFYYLPTLWGLCLLLVLKHRTNIARLQQGTENKIKWL